MKNPRRQPIDASSPPSTWRVAARAFAGALLVGLLLVRFAAADDHAHAVDFSGGESCAACLVGALPLDGVDSAVAVVPPPVVRSFASPVPPVAPVLERTTWLPPACGPPAGDASAST